MAIRGEYLGMTLTVDDLDICPAKVTYAIGYLILKALTLQVVAHLFLARLP